MYDTVNFWKEINNENEIHSICKYIENQQTTIGEDGNLLKISGHIENYKIDVNLSSITMYGSLAKYYLLSNVLTLTQKTTKDAVEKLSDCTHIDIKNANVRRLDISTVIETKHVPSIYFPYLGNKPKFERLQSTKNTLYYRTKQRQLVFYDKNKEVNKKKNIIPKIFEGKNLFKYELSIRSNLKRQLKINESIKGKMLYDNDFYYNNIQQWGKEFETIQKINTNMHMIDKIKTPKDAKDFIFSCLLQDIGVNGINDYVAYLKAINKYKDPKYYTRLSKDLFKLIEAPKEAKGECLKELENAISYIVKNAS
ncbi:phage/plasmid replication protein [Methanoculleus sp.]|uniref:phage/plasmid replication domain-containing protein n=1 Tax=Methanoculleus sp. TaxID=90427 RepID=UPI0025F6569B|nr:phage/plasmid replication protein [Methanoculleus sp.]MCK9320042.1 hypothetical protein [Methanoculleus sp.]